MSLLEAVLYLTLNVYHEARSEDRLAQLAVAHVTLNRARNRELPVKQIVLQPGQFSWTSQKKNWLPDDFPAFITCLETVTIAAATPDFTGGATHYHHSRIKPYWSKHLDYIADYGAHQFYK